MTINKLKYAQTLDFPGGLLVKIPCSKCKWSGFNPWGNEIPHAPTKNLQAAAKDPTCCNDNGRSCMPQLRSSTHSQINKYFLKILKLTKN